MRDRSLSRVSLTPPVISDQILNNVFLQKKYQQKFSIHLTS